MDRSETLWSGAGGLARKSGPHWSPASVTQVQSSITPLCSLLYTKGHGLQTEQGGKAVLPRDVTDTDRGVQNKREPAGDPPGRVGPADS